MIARRTLEILSAAHLVLGMSSSQHIPDRGFSPTSEGVNLTVAPGLLYFPDALDDGDSDNILNAATDTIIASCPDNETFNGDERRVVNGVGQYILYNGTKLGAVLRTDSTNTYSRGFTTMVNFGGEIRSSTRESIVRWDEGGGVFTVGYIDFSAITALSGIADVVPHPQIVFENNYYCASANEIFRETTVGTAPTAALLTLSTDQVITELGIDPGTGKMLIATSTAMDASLSVPAINKLMWYDGSSTKVHKVVLVEDCIIGMWTHQGRVYVGYGLNLGYLNGGGIEFLRRLAVTRSNATLPYRPSFASVGEILCIIERDKVIGYAEILPGQKAFYYIHGVPAQTKDIDHIFDAGAGKLGMSYANEAGTDAIFKTLDTTSVASVDDSVFHTNWFRFSRPIVPKEVIIEFADAINTANISLTYQDNFDSAITSNSLTVKESSSSIRTLTLRGFKANQRVTALRFNFGEASGNNKGIRRALLFYEVGE